MVFRKEKGNDGFQRQFSALRNQLGGHTNEDSEEPPAADAAAASASEYQSPSPNSSPAGYAERKAESYGNGGSIYAASESESQVAVPDAAGPPAFDLTTVPRGTDVSVIAHDAVWDGDLRTRGSLHVHGTVRGTLEATENVYVAEEANVDGTITAQNVVVGGLVKGMIHCSARFEALATGRLLADIQSPSVVIHEGATMRGAFQMDRSAPAEDKVGPSYRRASRHR